MSAGNNMEKSSGKKVMYKKECTVVLDVGENKKIAAGELIDFLCDDVGVVIHACVPKGTYRYEVTVEDIIQARMIYESDLLKLNGYEMKARLLYSESVVVSFLHLPAYITDDEIQERLTSMKIELVTSIYRRRYKGTNIADGTRYVRVKFPPEIKSLPYSMKFKTVEWVEYFRVLHNNQIKVCDNCMSANYVIRECPNIVCHYCKEKGHYARHCDKTFLCEKCGKKEDECVCSYNDSDSEYDNDSEQSDNEDMKEELQANKAKFNESKQVERAEAKHSENHTRKGEHKESPNSKTQGRVKFSEKVDAETMETEANNTMEDNSSQAKRSSRRSRIIKRPSDETIWSVVSTRKQKRQAARAKGVDESGIKRRMDESECKV